MTRKSTKTDLGSQALGLAPMRKVPTSLVRRHLAGETSDLQKELADRNRLQREAAKYASKGKRVPRTGLEQGTFAPGPAAIQKLLGKGPKLPQAIGEVSGIRSYSVRFAPTYDYAHAETDFDDLGNSKSANRFSGQMSLRFGAFRNDGVIHYARVEVGSFFFAPSGAARIRAQASPIVAYSWLMYSEGELATTEGVVALTITGFKGNRKQGAASGRAELWDETIGDHGVSAFRVGSEPASTKNLFAELALNGSDFYLVSLKASGFFASGNSPGTRRCSVGGMISVAVPSITLDVALDPVLELDH
jgi:hypothetical protein